MFLAGHEKALPLTFFYPECEGKKTAPQTYVRDVIRRQQELKDLCKRNTGTRNMLKLDKKEDLIRGLRVRKPIQSEIMSVYSKREFYQREPKSC